MTTCPINKHKRNNIISNKYRTAKNSDLSSFVEAIFLETDSHDIVIIKPDKIIFAEIKYTHTQTHNNISH